MIGFRVCNVWWFVFFNVWPLYFGLGGCNVFNYNPFLMIFSVPDVPKEGVQVLFGDQKQWSPPLGFSLPWKLKGSPMSCSTLGGRDCWNQIHPLRSLSKKLERPAISLMTGSLVWGEAGVGGIKYHRRSTLVFRRNVSSVFFLLFFPFFYIANTY